MRALVNHLADVPAADVKLVLSNDPGSAGLAWAAAQGIATVAVDHKPFAGDRAAFEAALNATLTPHDIDLICLAGFMRVLTADFVAGWTGRMVNIHPSILPKYKGLHTHKRALDAGETTHGCTVHRVTAALDDGPILGQATVPVKPDDTPETLAARVLTQEHKLYPAVVARLLAGQENPLHLSFDAESH